MRVEVEVKCGGCRGTKKRLSIGGLILLFLGGPLFWFLYMIGAFTGDTVCLRCNGRGTLVLLI